MTMQGVVDAWMTDLLTVSGLTTIPAKCQHKYAPWSQDQLVAGTNERHIAIWPEGDPDARRQATTDGADEITTSYVVTVWEEAASEATGLYDDDAANIAWLALYEAVRARFYVLANLAIGETGSDVHYEGGAFGMQGAVRFFSVRFSKRYYKLFT